MGAASHMKRTKTKPKAEPETVQWADIAKSADALGLVDDFSKTSAFQLRKRLLKTGRVSQVARGRFEIIKWPD